MNSKRIVLFALVVGLVFFGITNGTSATPQATVTMTNVSIPIDLVVFVPCADNGMGEFVDLSGDLHILIHVTISNSGRVTVKQHTQPQGISGIGQSTGDRYRGTGVTQSTQTFDGIDGFPFQTTLVNNFRIIGQGPGNNFLVHENSHITINANGEVTAEVDNLSVDCK